MNKKTYILINTICYLNIAIFIGFITNVFVNGSWENSRQLGLFLVSTIVVDGLLTLPSIIALLVREYTKWYVFFGVVSFLILMFYVDLFFL